jgi:hypothetical protein
LFRSCFPVLPAAPDDGVVEIGVRQKGIIRQVRRDAICCRMRSNFSLISAELGAGRDVGVFRPTALFHGFDFFLVVLVEADRALDLIQRQRQ